MIRIVYNTLALSILTIVSVQAADPIRVITRIGSAACTDTMVKIDRANVLQTILIMLSPFGRA